MCVRHYLSGSSSKKLEETMADLKSNEMFSTLTNDHLRKLATAVQVRRSVRPSVGAVRPSVPEGTGRGTPEEGHRREAHHPSIHPSHNLIEKLTSICSVVPYVNTCSLFAIN